MDTICADLTDEHAGLDDVVSELSEAEWQAPTPAEGSRPSATTSSVASTDSARHRPRPRSPAAGRSG
jgi:hypothetical protein